MRDSTALKRLTGLLLLSVSLLVILHEWGVDSAALAALPVLVVVVLAIFFVQIGTSGRAFILVAVALSLALYWRDPDWQVTLLRGLGSAAFIAAFFSALTTLRNVASSSPSIKAAGRFLAAQKPGRRYAALTIGGQGFALLLNYGAIQLLGSLALASARDEPNAEIRDHRIRRMLLAIQRAFVSTLSWSPLSFAMAISTTVIAGSSWINAVAPGLVTSALLAGIGWGLDTAFKPRLTTTPRRIEPEGSWALMLPLVLLLGILVISVSLLYWLTNVRIVGLVAVIVPIIALFWAAIQHGSEPTLLAVARRSRVYLFDELPAYSGELTLLMMAGFIGTVGAALLVPLLTAAGFDLSSIPPWAILVSLVWLIPAAGQIGMNPILAVTLIAPLLPSASDLGVTPTAIVVAITSGWALSGASSPYTATTLLIGSFGGISAAQVGLRWNLWYTLLSGVVLSLWVVVYGLAIGV